MSPKVTSIRLAETDADIEAAWPVMAQLRTHIPQDLFVARVRRQMETGYRLVILVDDRGVRVAAGFRTGLNLAWGSYLYVDDLVVDSNARLDGHGKALMGWLEATARGEGCGQIHLDSGVQRASAHRFYRREEMENRSLHFVKTL